MALVQSSMASAMRSPLAIGALVSMFLSPMELLANTASFDLRETVTFDIPAEPLTTALLQFSSQASVQVATSGPEVGRARSPGAIGTMSIATALSSLLANTGFTYQISGQRSIAVVLSDKDAPATPATGLPTTMTATENIQQGMTVEEEPHKASESVIEENVNRQSLWTRIVGFFNGEKKVNLKKRNSDVAKAVFLCSSMATSCGVYAQTTSTAATGGDALEEVTITGSRVITNGNASPTPVTVVSLDQLMTANPGSVTQALAQLPALLATPNQGGQGPNPQAVINLRGIGGQRNLVLFDGHRLAHSTNGPFQQGTGVDANLIPQMLLKRVDIVTGGASAVYGSDAVSGVINYIVDNNFNGVKLVGQAGQSTYHDDRTYNFGIAVGTPVLGERGHIEFSYQNFNDPGVSSRYSRGWGRGLYSMQGSVPGSTAAAGTAANPWTLYSNTRLNSVSFGGLINSGSRLAGLQFAQNGVLSTFDRGAPTGSSAVSVGGDGAYYTTTAAFGGQNMDQAFGRFDFDFTDSVKGYVEIAATSVLNWANGNNFEVRNRQIGYNNAYLSGIQPAYQSQLALDRAANPNGAFTFSRILNQLEQIPASMTETRAKQYLYLAGLQGALGDYKWDIGYERFSAVATNYTPYNYSNTRLFAAMNAVVDPATNRVVCNAALVNPAVYGNCVPLNLFGPTASSREAFEYIRNPSWVASRSNMDDVTASITGAPLSSWAGPINMALSGEWRRQTFGIASTVSPTDPVDCTGIQFNCVPAGASNSTSPYATTAVNFPTRSMSVGEVAYEAQVPLLEDKFLAKSLAVNGAARYTNYSTSGSVSTWKLGLTHAANDSLHFRVARSRDIRAPTVQNLYNPPTSSPITIPDQHIVPPAGGNNNVTVTQITEGNPNLKPEIADTVTAGFVWTPGFIEGLSLSMDYYHIKIKDGLTFISATSPLVQQTCEASNGASPVCALLIRNPALPFSDRSAANSLTAVKNAYLNTAGFLTYGVDTEINYSHPIGGHDFGMRLLLNYQPHLIYDFGPTGIVDAAGAADGVPALPATANVKGLFQVNYEVVDNLMATVQARYRNAMKQNGSTVPVFAIGKLPPAWYADMTLNYKLAALKGDMDLFFNVKNVFNKQPDPWASTGLATGLIGSFGGWLQGDDPLGRYYTVGFRYKL